MTNIGQRRGQPFWEQAASLTRDLATWARGCRKLLGLSQTELAVGAGISQGAVSRMESGRCVETPLPTYVAVLRFLEATARPLGLAVPDPGALLRTPEAYSRDEYCHPPGGTSEVARLLAGLTELTPVERRWAFASFRALVSALRDSREVRAMVQGT